jgi:hypothetical protein
MGGEATKGKGDRILEQALVWIEAQLDESEVV